MNKVFSEFPKGKINSISGRCIHIKGNDIDTDRIIPARFLKCISFENLGEEVFADDRAEEKGNHPFDSKENQGARILIVNKNFGCGSSREHAPQALMRWGIRGIIGNSFAEIFHGNCLSLGIPCITLSEIDLTSLTNKLKENYNELCTINLIDRKVILNKSCWELKIEQGAEEMLKSGNWDATSTLISKLNEIDIVKNRLPYINSFNLQK